MKCGFCKTDGVNVAHVKDCANQKGIRPADNQEEIRPERSERPARTRDRHHDERRALIAEVRAVSATVEEGHYAVIKEDGDLAFYRVEKGSGKWEGRTFLTLQVSDDFVRVPGGLKTELAVYQKIAANPNEAMYAYGKGVGRCGHCRRGLTSLYREYGIGPVCARNLGDHDLAREIERRMREMKKKSKAA